MADITWAVTVLAYLNLARSGVNVSALHAWADSEGMPDWANNWLASKRRVTGSRAYDSSGVQVYPTYQIGIDATVASLRAPGMNGVIATLQAQGDYEQIWQAVNRSPWRPRAQSGRYPVVLWNLVGHPERAAVQPASADSNQQLYDWSDHVRNAGSTLSGGAGKVLSADAAIRGLMR